MRTPASPDPGRSADPVTAVLNGARDVVAERGLGQLSLRVVAERAGLSVGTISYRIGDRAALIGALAEREIALADEQCAVWERRIVSVPSGDRTRLADTIGAWLHESANSEKTAAIVQGELVAGAFRNNLLDRHVAAIALRQQRMWRALLSGWPEPERLALRIASYCIDERPFSVLLDGLGDYVLLRASTIRGLVADPTAANVQHDAGWHMHLVGLLETPARAAFAAEPPTHGAKAAVAERIADIIIKNGLAILSHRSIAQALAMPVSSVAHHFPTQRDLLLGGVETLYRGLRAEVRAMKSDVGNAQTAGSAVVALGHEMALAALRDPAFLPFAVDMRRRRAENVHAAISRILTGSDAADRGMIQGYVMAMIGMALGGIAGRGHRHHYEAMLEKI